jgi:hypothetical protein
MRTPAGRTRAHALISALDRARDHASDLTVALAHEDFARARELAREVARDINLARAREDLLRGPDCHLDPDLAGVLDRVRVGTRDVKLLLDRACDDLLERSPHSLHARDGFRGRRAAVRVSPIAGRLVAAARLLPARERTRYAEEFRSELWEIA